LTNQIRATPADAKLLDDLNEGMRSDIALRAINYIHYAAKLSDIPIVRDELELIVKKRLLDSDIGVSKACSQQLEILVHYSPNNFDTEIWFCLKLKDNDRAWYALKAIAVLGKNGDRFTSEVGGYLNASKDFVNTVGSEFAAEALWSIGSEKALAILAGYEESENTTVQEFAEKASQKLKLKNSL